MNIIYDDENLFGFGESLFSNLTIPSNEEIQFNSLITNNSNYNTKFNENNIFEIRSIDKNKEDKNENRKIFYIHDINNILEKKRGRKTKDIKIKIHDKYTIDNILRKIQVHYLNFLVEFINEILKYLGFKQRLFSLDYNFKKKCK